VVTHDPGVAARFRRRVTLRDGRLAGAADPEPAR
jgi:predicted ABC-type transport system involved in lysophospholipase L1 biosynthesis ATPase subunit